jgi:hypothetical protein
MKDWSYTSTSRLRIKWLVGPMHSLNYYYCHHHYYYYCHHYYYPQYD